MNASAQAQQGDGEARATASQLVRIVFKLARQRLQQMPSDEAERCLAGLKTGGTRIQIVLDVSNGETEITFPMKDEAA